MTNPMTPARLSQINARCEAATEGPWEDFQSCQNAISIYFGDPPQEICSYVTDAVSCKFPVRIRSNMNFIAHARQDLPDCLAEIERLKGLLKVAKCPNCDGSGGIPHQVAEAEWEQEQCQWCDEIKALEAE